jgi:hypothetical protein
MRVITVRRVPPLELKVAFGLPLKLSRRSEALSEASAPPVPTAARTDRTAGVPYA